MYKASKYNLSLNYKERIFVFNCVSSAGAYIDGDIGELLSRNQLSENEIELLLRNHFIVPYEMDEEAIELRKTQDALYGEHFNDQSFIITPTLECNANCDYCFEKGKRNTSDMPIHIQDRIIEYITDRLSAHPETKDVNISFFGGEPTLRIGIIDRISSSIQNYCRKNELTYHARVITNGILLNSKNCNKIRNAGIDRCQITIDGMPKTWAKKKRLPESLFYTVVENIRSAVDCGIRVIVRVNIDNSNCAEIPELMKLLLEEENLNGKIKMIPAKIKKWNDALLDDYMSNSDYYAVIGHYRALALENNWYNSFDSSIIGGRVASCGMVRNAAIGIRYDGLLFRCEHCFAIDEIDGHPAEIGDIENGLYDSDIDRKFKSENPPSDRSISNCVECAYYPLCHGGCRAQVLINHQENDCEEFMKDVLLRLTYRLQIEDCNRR